MPRIARPVFPGVPHHITQRGNRRENVFFSDGDRAAYLGWLAEYSVKFDVRVLAYCLMTNHIHLVAIPETEDALEKIFRPLHTRYAQRINRARGWSGRLWRGRYFSSALDERYLWEPQNASMGLTVRLSLILMATGAPQQASVVSAKTRLQNRGIVCGRWVCRKSLHLLLEVNSRHFLNKSFYQ